MRRALSPTLPLLAWILTYWPVAGVLLFVIKPGSALESLATFATIVCIVVTAWVAANKAEHTALHWQQGRIRRKTIEATEHFEERL